jgi:hypothetical protein
MVLVTVAALVAAWVTARALGGDAGTARAATLALAIGSVLTLGPAVLRIDREHWGVAVLACGMGRGLVTLGAAYLMAAGNDALAPRPLYLGAVAGVLVVLLAESVAAILILSSLERRRAAHVAGQA